MNKIKTPSSLTKQSSKFIVYAPTIHTGGGLVLLRELLKNPPQLDAVYLAERALNKLDLSQNINFTLVKQSITARFLAEWSLKKKTSAQDTILCFHGLPPLFSLKNRKVKIFLQNCLLLDRSSLRNYSLKTRIRLQLERLLLRLKHHPSFEYIVQTPSMLKATKTLFGPNCQVRLFPFHVPLSTKKDREICDYDFIYVASGEPHKNHLNLLEAWKLLKSEGLTPSLALTLDEQIFQNLVLTIKQSSLLHSLNITNLSSLSHQDVLNLYPASGALIYPSQRESLGLPLLEASQQGLPIIASEKDYVRDSVHVTESFDPDSPLSIARAVKRHLGIKESIVPPYTSTDFLKEVMK